MTYLIIDFSNITFKIFFGMKPDKNIDLFQDDKNIFKFKHMVIMNLILYVKKFNISYKNVIIAIDDTSNWRTKYFKYYKYRRKLKRKGSDIDWNKFFEIQNELISELDENFEFNILKQKWCEGDDIVYHSAKHLSKYYDVIVISRDKDLKQVLQLDNVKLFNIDKKSFIKSKKEDIKLSTMIHIMNGDAGDDIPNFISDDDTYYLPEKKSKRLGEKKSEKIILNDELREMLKDEQIKNNYIRNKRLIDLNSVPKKIVERIIEKIDNNKDVDISDTIEYLKENKMVNIINEIKGVEGSFESTKNKLKILFNKNKKRKEKF